MHLMVLVASRPDEERVLQCLSRLGLNAPDGAGCFPTPENSPWDISAVTVSMHLMVLGASRRKKKEGRNKKGSSLNAPDGAGCFPT